jgi:hypothetical protein
MDGFQGRERESKIGWGWNNWVTLFCSQLFLQNKKIAAGIIFKNQGHWTLKHGQ